MALFLFWGLFSTGVSYADQTQTMSVSGDDLASPSAEAEPELVPPYRAPPAIRISSIVEQESGRLAGLIDQESRFSAWVSEGGSFLNYVVESIDPDKQEVRLRVGEVIFSLFLQGSGETTVQRYDDYAESEGMALDSGSLESDVKTVEDFIRENYEAAGMRSADDPIPEKYVTPVSREEALRRMADLVGVPFTEDLLEPVSQEEFMQKIENQTNSIGFP